MLRAGQRLAGTNIQATATLQFKANNTITTINTTELLREILSRRPNMDLHEIRRSHSIFKTMSLDHLGLRVGQVARSLADMHWR
jgi:hypothetical protein